MVITTQNFRELTHKVATSLGYANLRILTVGHPLGGTSEEVVREWADDAVEETINLLTGERT